MSRKKRKQTTRQTGGERTQPADQLTAEEQAAAAERRARQLEEWERRKKAKERKKTPVALYGWLAGGAVAIVAVALGAFLLLQDDSGADSPPVASATPDARVAGLTVATTVEIEADDQGQNIASTFTPTTVTGAAGEVVEIVLKNEGTVPHNISVAGIDEEFGTRDDFITDPGTVRPGEEGRVRVKIDEPGTYPFQCDFHPDQQRGNLVLT